MQGLGLAIMRTACSQAKWYACLTIALTASIRWGHAAVAWQQPCCCRESGTLVTLDLQHRIALHASLGPESCAEAALMHFCRGLHVGCTSKAPMFISLLAGVMAGAYLRR
jgi:hypothetical protein